ncbi:hypothetical protein Tco_1166259 [Tanacetum coccineum]
MISFEGRSFDMKQCGNESDFSWNEASPSPSLYLYRYPVDTSLIHIESRKSPTAVLFDDDTGRISIRHCEY